MLIYPIRLATVTDFRNYQNMIYQFHIGGFLLIEGRRIHISSFLEIMSHCPQTHFTMVITRHRREETAELEAYLQKYRLLCEGCSAKDGNSIASSHHFLYNRVQT